MPPFLSIILIGSIATAAAAAGAVMDWTPLANIGPVGIILIWFMWRAEPRLRAIESAIDRQTRGNLVMLIEIKRTSPEGKTVAEGIIKEIEAAGRQRGEPDK